MARHGGIGQRVGFVEVGGQADDAVELAAELQLAAEQPAMDALVFRRIMGEVHAQRPPVRTEQRAAQAEQHADGQLQSLAHRHGRVGEDFFAHDHQLAVLLDVDRQRLVDQVAVAGDGVERVAQGRLVGEQQADRAEVGELARFGHAQAEVLAVAGVGRVFQQGHGGGGGDALFGVVEDRQAEAGVAQLLLRVQAQVAGHFQVIGQSRSTHHGRGHYQAPERLHGR
ncbi:hypothetical protein D3C78_1271070 [compost metagenome]